MAQLSPSRNEAGNLETARRTRILFVGHTGDLGGAEVALLRIVRELDRCRFDLSVVLFSDGALAGLLREAGVSVEVLPLAPRVVKTSRHATAGSVIHAGTVLLTIRYIMRFAKFMRERHFDIVHSNSLKAGVIGGLASRLAGQRHVWHLHDRIAADYMPRRVASVLGFLIRRLPQFLVVNSRATLDTVEPYDRARCAVIYPGVEVESTPCCRPLPSGGALIGLVGRISKTKGQDIFLRAAAKVSARFPGVRFQVIGGALFNDQPFEDEVHALSSSLGLDGIVEFTGFVQNVEERFAALDIVVHASPTPEPFGQVAAEGMAAGKPVIATRAGGIPEIVVHEETGLLVAPGDVDELAEAICRLLADASLASRLAARGREHVVKWFNIQRSARQIETVYAQLLGLPPGQEASASPIANMLQPNC